MRVQALVVVACAFSGNAQIAPNALPVQYGPNAAKGASITGNNWLMMQQVRHFQRGCVVFARRDPSNTPPPPLTVPHSPRWRVLQCGECGCLTAIALSGCEIPYPCACRVQGAVHACYVISSQQQRLSLRPPAPAHCTLRTSGHVMTSTWSTAAWLACAVASQLNLSKTRSLTQS
jgi:hypothetical protein